LESLDRWQEKGGGEPPLHLADLACGTCFVVCRRSGCSGFDWRFFRRTVGVAIRTGHGGILLRTGGNFQLFAQRVFDFLADVLVFFQENARVLTALAHALAGKAEPCTGLFNHASVRIDIRRIAAIKEGDVVVGSRTKVKVVKNKVAAPFRESEFDIMYGQGISREGDLLDLAVNQNILEKSGAWFSYKGERIGQGRENARQFLKDNKEVTMKLDAEVKKALGLTPTQPAAQAQSAAQGASPGARVTPMPTGTEGKASARR